MIPDRITATLILLAILAAMLVLAVPAIWLVRWLAGGGKHLDGLGPIAEQPRKRCPWCDDKSCNDATKCNCGDDPCGKTYCIPVLRAELHLVAGQEGGQ